MDLEAALKRCREKYFWEVEYPKGKRYKCWGCKDSTCSLEDRPVLSVDDAKILAVQSALMRRTYGTFDTEDGAQYVAHLDTMGRVSFQRKKNSKYEWVKGPEGVEIPQFLEVAMNRMSRGWKYNA